MNLAIEFVLIKFIVLHSQYLRNFLDERLFVQVPRGTL